MTGPYATNRLPVAGSPSLVAVLTPRGRGAVASLSVTGPQALSNVQHLFTPVAGRPLTDYPVNRPVLGSWHRAGHGESTDELLVVCRTGDESLEVHSHGGFATQQFILDTLTEFGCQIVRSDEWVPRRDLDRMTREAYQALPNARTLPAASILLDQYRGALASDLRRAQAALVAQQPNAARDILEQLLARSRLGLHLTDPFRIAVIGRANVGKSSLVNAILGYQRSLVHQEAGTTRDVLTACTALQGWPVQLADTAGYRATDDQLEGAGIERATHTAASADLVLLVADVTLAWNDAQRISGHQPASAPLIVHNKSDLVVSRPTDRPAGWMVSALTGQGLSELIQEMGRRLVPEIPPPGSAVPFRDEHVRVLARTLSALRDGDRAHALRSLETLLIPPATHSVSARADRVPEES